MYRQIINKEGFTLIEIMIAMTIFSIGILGVAAMQIHAIGGNASSSGLTVASTVAQDRIENLLTLNYTNPLINDTNGDGTNQDLNSDGVDDDGGNFGLDVLAAPDGFAQYSGPAGFQYNISWNVAVNFPFTDTKTIRVNVGWVENGRTRLVTLSSIKPRT